MKYNVKSSYYYKGTNDLQLKDKYPVRIDSGTASFTVAELIAEVKSELLPDKKLDMVEEVFKIDGVTASGTASVPTDKRLEYSITLWLPGHVDAISASGSNTALASKFNALMKTKKK